MIQPYNRSVQGAIHIMSPIIDSNKIIQREFIYHPKNHTLHILINGKLRGGYTGRMARKYYSHLIGRSLAM
jgi:hypothetical protein